MSSVLRSSLTSIFQMILRITFIELAARRERGERELQSHLPPPINKVISALSNGLFASRLSVPRLRCFQRGRPPQICHKRLSVQSDVSPVIAVRVPMAGEEVEGLEGGGGEGGRRTSLCVFHTAITRSRSPMK